MDKRKIGIDGDGTAEIIDFKEASEKIAALVDGKAYLPGYHMNKKHWYTILLDKSAHRGHIQTYRRQLRYGK